MNRIKRSGKVKTVGDLSRLHILLVPLRGFLTAVLTEEYAVRGGNDAFASSFVLKLFVVCW